MTEPRLKSGLWVQAQLRRADREGRALMVLRKGDADAGVVIVKVLDGDGRVRLFVQATDADGGLAWQRPLGAAPVAEPEADDYIARQVRFDPDIWAVEVLDRGGNWRPEGRILDLD